MRWCTARVSLHDRGPAAWLCLIDVCRGNVRKMCCLAASTPSGTAGRRTEPQEYNLAPSVPGMAAGHGMSVIL